MRFLKHTISSYTNVIFIAIPLIVIVILRVIDFDGLYGQDAYEYLRYTEAIKVYIVDGIHPGQFYWPVLYPFLGAILGFIFNNTVLGLQILSGLSLSICFICCLKTIKLLYPNHKFATTYVFVFGLFCPYLFKMGLVVMSDMTSAMFIALCFYFFFKAHKKQTSLAYFFFFATCAVMTRYASIVIVFPIVIYGLYLIVKRKTVSQFLVAILYSAFAILPFIILQWDGLFEAGSNYFLKSWSVTNFFKSSYTTTDGLQSYLLPNSLYTLYVFLHPGFIFIGLILCFFTLKNYKSIFNFPQKIIGLCILFYLVFMAGIPFQNPRILGLVFPLVILLFYPSFKKVFKIVRVYYLPILFAAIIVQLFLFNRTFSSVFKRNHFEREIVSLITSYQGHTLYSFDVDIALQGRGLNFEYKNMYVEKYNDYQPEDLVLFHPIKFNKQWQNKNPMLNWHYIKTNYQLKIIEETPDGWKLYKIENKK